MQFKNVFFFHSNQKLRPICRIKFDGGMSEHSWCVQVCETNLNFLCQRFANFQRTIWLQVVMEFEGMIRLERVLRALCFTFFFVKLCVQLSINISCLRIVYELYLQIKCKHIFPTSLWTSEIVPHQFINRKSHLRNQCEQHKKGIIVITRNGQAIHIHTLV